MVTWLDRLPIELVMIIWDYKLEMEEYDRFLLFLDLVFATLVPKNQFWVRFLRFWAFFRSGLD